MMTAADAKNWLDNWLTIKSSSHTVTYTSSTADASYVALDGSTQAVSITGASSDAHAMAQLISDVTPHTSVSQGYAQY